MTALLTLDSISLTTPDGRPLFDGLTLALGAELLLFGRRLPAQSADGSIERSDAAIHVIGAPRQRLSQILDDQN